MIVRVLSGVMPGLSDSFEFRVLGEAVISAFTYTDEKVCVHVLESGEATHLQVVGDDGAAAKGRLSHTVALRRGQIMVVDGQSVRALLGKMGRGLPPPPTPTEIEMAVRDLRRMHLQVGRQLDRESPLPPFDHPDGGRRGD